MKIGMVILLGLLIIGCNANGNQRPYNRCEVLIPPDFWEESGCKIVDGHVVDTTEDKKNA